VVGEDAFPEKQKRLESWCDDLWSQARGQPGDVKIPNRLRKPWPPLLGRLYEPAAKPTNNRAERSLRPAVIARKLSCGNKTERGRDCWQILTSFAATYHQKPLDFIDYLEARLPLAPQGR